MVQPTPTQRQTSLFHFIPSHLSPHPIFASELTSNPTSPFVLVHISTHVPLSCSCSVAHPSHPPLRSHLLWLNPGDFLAQFLVATCYSCRSSPIPIPTPLSFYVSSLIVGLSLGGMLTGLAPPSSPTSSPISVALTPILSIPPPPLLSVPLPHPSPPLF